MSVSLQDFKYEDGIPMYLVKNEDGQEKWSYAQSSEVMPLIRNFWQNQNSKKKAEFTQKPYPMQYKKPIRIIETKELPTKGILFLTQFENFETPVYVRYQTLFNMNPSLVTNFLEEKWKQKEIVMKTTKETENPKDQTIENDNSSDPSLYYIPQPLNFNIRIQSITPIGPNGEILFKKQPETENLIQSYEEADQNKSQTEDNHEEENNELVEIAMSDTDELIIIQAHNTEEINEKEKEEQNEQNKEPNTQQKEKETEEGKEENIEQKDELIIKPETKDNKESKEEKKIEKVEEKTEESSNTQNEGISKTEEDKTEKIKENQEKEDVIIETSDSGANNKNQENENKPEENNKIEKGKEFEDILHIEETAEEKNETSQFLVIEKDDEIPEKDNETSHPLTGKSIIIDDDEFSNVKEEEEIVEENVKEEKHQNDTESILREENHTNDIQKEEDKTEEEEEDSNIIQKNTKELISNDDEEYDEDDSKNQIENPKLAKGIKDIIGDSP